jgi:hypothetical protein
MRLLLEAEGKGREITNRAIIRHFENDLELISHIKGYANNQTIKEY